MNIKELNKAIDSLGRKNQSVEAEIQKLGLACMAHADQHGDTMPMNRLINVLRRTQYRAFLEWAMAFGKFVKNMDKATKEAQPVSYDKSKTTDIDAATAKPWFMFADDKATATAKAFDFQQAVMSLLKKAAAAGIDHTKLVAVAAVADIKPEKVPATVLSGADAEKAVGDGIV